MTKPDVLHKIEEAGQRFQTYPAILQVPVKAIVTVVCVPTLLVCGIGWIAFRLIAGPVIGFIEALEDIKDEILFWAKK